MKRLFAALALSVLLAPASLSQTSAVPVRDGDDFRGPVRSLRIETVRVSRRNDEYVESQRVLTQLKSYSSDGRQCETLFYKPDGSQFKKDLIVYNETGKWSEWNSYDAYGLTTLRRTNTFDERGRITVETTFKGDGTVRQRKVLVWNSVTGTISEIDTFNGDGELIRKDVSEYDIPNGKLIWHTEETGGKQSKSTFDIAVPDPNLQEVVQYNTNGTLASKRTSTKSPAAQKIENTTYDANGSVISKLIEDRERDSQNNVVKITRSKVNKETGALEPVFIIYQTISYY